MASKEQLNFNEPHPPAENALDAFSTVVSTIRREIIKSRRHWDKHEPMMWSRAVHLSDHELTSFSLSEDLVLVSSAPTTYGTIILGRIRIPAINDDQGEGFIHVRIHDPPNRVLPLLPLTANRVAHLKKLYQRTEDITFHSIFTDEGNRDKDGRPTTWQAIQADDTPLIFFDE